MKMSEEYKHLAEVWSKHKGLMQMQKQICSMGVLQSLMKQMEWIGAKDMKGMLGGGDNWQVNFAHEYLSHFLLARNAPPASNLF